MFFHVFLLLSMSILSFKVYIEGISAMAIWHYIYLKSSTQVNLGPNANSTT